jgi:hypothetical protein
MERKYLITQEQIEKIEHIKRMFEFNADLLRDLCSDEKDDIVYGFELGKMYNHLRECFMDMMDLESDIRSQMIEEDKKTKNKN